MVSLTISSSGHINFKGYTAVEVEVRLWIPIVNRSEVGSEMILVMFMRLKRPEEERASRRRD